MRRIRVPLGLAALAGVILVGEGIGHLVSEARAQTNPVLTTEVLVGTTATAMPQLASRRGIEVQNLGPNAIFCSLTDATKAVLNKARKIDAGGSWALELGPGVPIYCISSAAQVTGAATVVTEVR